MVDGGGAACSAATAARGWRRAIGPLVLVNLALLPVAWLVPLFTARVPFLWRQDVSVMGGLAELWRLDRVLFAVVLLLAVVMPLLKGLAVAAVWYLVPVRRAADALRRMEILGKLAMTEVFLLAVVIVGLKGVGLGRIEIAWGLHLFVAAALLSLASSLLAARAVARPPG
jgi:paraquat-inducible protein A